MRTEDGMTEMDGNPFVRDNPTFRHLGPSHATADAQAFVQIS